VDASYDKQGEFGSVWFKKPDGTSGYWINGRFSLETHKRDPIPFFITTITEEILVDMKTKETLAKEVRVGSSVGNLSTGGGYKFWLPLKPCRPDRLVGLEREIRNMRSKR
jgi:hypothetical protein